MEITTYAVFLAMVLQAYADLAEDQTSKSNVTVKLNAEQQETGVMVSTFKNAARILQQR